MLNTQDNKCAICKQPFVDSGRKGCTPSVDHNHTTQEVRATLCGNCNRGIGLLQENVTILHNAIEYLNKFNRKDPNEY